MFRGSLRQYNDFSLYQGISQRGGERKIDLMGMRKMSKQPSAGFTLTASTVGPCTAVIQISRTPDTENYLSPSPNHNHPLLQCSAAEMTLTVNGQALFLAHLSHRLRVSYCHWPMSVVRRPSCVVNNCLKQHLL